MTVRWKLETLDNVSSYTLHMNPNDAETLVPPTPMGWSRGRGVAAGSVRPIFVGNHQTEGPLPWQISGVLRDEAQYDEMLGWLGRGTKIRLTTDLGQVLIVRLLSFTPKRVGSQRRAAPFRHTYVMKALVYP